MEDMEFLCVRVEWPDCRCCSTTTQFSEGIGIIRWVYVHPKYWRKGIGTALIRHIEEVARRLNLRKLCLITLEKVWAVKFYEKLGFVIKDRVKRLVWYDVVMEKEIK